MVTAVRGNISGTYLWHLLPEDQSISTNPYLSSASCRTRTYNPLIKSRGRTSVAYDVTVWLTFVWNEFQRPHMTIGFP